MTLAEFLLERIHEEEIAACAASPGPWSYSLVDSVGGGTIYDETRRIVDVCYEQPDEHDGRIVRHLPAGEANANGEHIIRHNPARVLADCEVRRRIVERHTLTEFVRPRGVDRRCYICGDEWPCPDLRDMGSVYSKHPDYREEWRP